MYISRRDGLLQGLVRQFIDTDRERIASILCMCPSIEFAQENNSVLDFCNVTKVTRISVNHKHIVSLKEYNLLVFTDNIGAKINSEFSK